MVGPGRDRPSKQRKKLWMLGPVIAKLCLVQRPPGPHGVDLGSTAASLAVEWAGANRPPGLAPGRAGRRGGFAPTPLGLCRSLGPGTQGERRERDRLDQVPLVWDREPELNARLAGKTPAVFLDYDGTLSPIVEPRPGSPAGRDTRHDRGTRPPLPWPSSAAAMWPRCAAWSSSIASTTPAATASRSEVPRAGTTPWRRGSRRCPSSTLPSGCVRRSRHRRPQVERKRFSIAIHYRRVAPAEVGRLAQVVERVAAGQPRLRPGQGKKVLRLQPDLDWDKGHAVLWLLERLDLDRPEVLPIYIGDDVTDEDALRALPNAASASWSGARTTRARPRPATRSPIRRRCGAFSSCWSLWRQGGGDDRVGAGL